MRRELRPVRERHDDPEIPAGISAKDLPFAARVQLKTLTKENADFVASHLATAALVIEADPELAHQHALSASRRGGRIAMVRETLGITAYQTGDFALALRELRTYRRISGSDDQLALMIDSERGLGRPDRALELGRSADISALPADQRVNVAIAMSGARLDQEQPELARAELEIEQLDERRAFSYSPAIFLAYAEVLRELKRDTEADKWERLARRATAALEAAAHNEHETVEVISEDLKGDDLAAYIEVYGPIPGTEGAEANEANDANDANDANADEEQSDAPTASDSEPGVDDVVGAPDAAVDDGGRLSAQQPDVPVLGAPGEQEDSEDQPAGSETATLEQHDDSESRVSDEPSQSTNLADSVEPAATGENDDSSEQGQSNAHPRDSSSSEQQTGDDGAGDGGASEGDAPDGDGGASEGDASVGDETKREQRDEGPTLFDL